VDHTLWHIVPCIYTHIHSFTRGQCLHYPKGLLSHGLWNCSSFYLISQSYHSLQTSLECVLLSPIMAKGRQLVFLSWQGVLLKLQMLLISRYCVITIGGRTSLVSDPTLSKVRNSLTLRLITLSPYEMSTHGF